MPPSISSPNPYGSGSKFHPADGSKSRARVDSRKQKVGSSGINKNSFYRSRQNAESVGGSKPGAGGGPIGAVGGLKSGHGEGGPGGYKGLGGPGAYYGLGSGAAGDASKLP